MIIFPALALALNVLFMMGDIFGLFTNKEVELDRDMLTRHIIAIAFFFFNIVAIIGGHV